MKRKPLNYTGQARELGTGVYGLGLAFEINRLLNADCNRSELFVSWKAYAGPLLFHGQVPIPWGTRPFKD